MQYVLAHDGDASKSLQRPCLRSTLTLFSRLRWGLARQASLEQASEATCGYEWHCDSLQGFWQATF